MGSLNKVMLIGNLGRDAELKFTPSGFPISTFSIATTDKRKDKDGEWIEKTEWHRIKLLGKTAENLQDYLVKGKQVYVEGRLETRSWEDQETGKKVYMTEIIGDRIQLLGGPREGNGGGRGQGRSSTAERAGQSARSRQQAEEQTDQTRDDPFDSDSPIGGSSDDEPFTDQF